MIVRYDLGKAFGLERLMQAFNVGTPQQRQNIGSPQTSAPQPQTPAAKPEEGANRAGSGATLLVPPDNGGILGAKTRKTLLGGV